MYSKGSSIGDPSETQESDEIKCKTTSKHISLGNVNVAQGCLSEGDGGASLCRVNLIVERGAYGPRLLLWVTDGRRANGDGTVEATIFCLLSLIQIC